MALTQDTSRNSRPRGRNAYIVGNTTQIRAGSLVGIDTDSGYLELWADDADYVFKGVAERGVLGDTVLAAVPPECEVNEQGLILVNVSVAGVTAIASVGAAVYATDDDTLTLTPTSNTKPVGHIVRWNVTTYCDVELVTPGEYLDWGYYD